MLSSYLPKSPKETIVRVGRIVLVCSLILFATSLTSVHGPTFPNFTFSNKPNRIPYGQLFSLIDGGLLEVAQIDGATFTARKTDGSTISSELPTGINAATNIATACQKHLVSLEWQQPDGSELDYIYTTHVSTSFVLPAAIALALLFDGLLVYRKRRRAMLAIQKDSVIRIK
jgi:hypothetical protein